MRTGLLSTCPLQVGCAPCLCAPCLCAPCRCAPCRCAPCRCALAVRVLADCGARFSGSCRGLRSGQL